MPLARLELSAPQAGSGALESLEPLARAGLQVPLGLKERLA